MKAYYYDDVPGDQRLAHDSGEQVSLDTLSHLGVTYRSIPIDAEGKWQAEIDEFAKERSYKNRDQITVTPEGLGAAYEDKIRSFFDEHLHEDEEIRYVLGGSGFFDVRGGAGAEDKKWVRIAVEKGDLIIIPAGIYHRFTVDERNTITALRLFQDEPKWTPYSRSDDTTEARPARKEYLDAITA
ncbi:1,2-dihydroxy-3-keto-5-methylthiopentene dioxygenase [Vanrija albida]|uniref:Acireductone dioxygenase n=1 Tax=Vanrija albida TaxID=181172 RepID=A0ABR3Q2Z4_9TREE